MNQQPSNTVSIWRQSRPTETVHSALTAMTPPTKRLPIASLTAGQGKIQTAA